MTRYERWSRRLHAPADPRLLALLRIGVGGVVFLRFALSAPDVIFWWGESGVLSKAQAFRMVAPEWGSVFRVLPDHDLVTWCCWGLATTQAALLTLGLWSRFQAASVFAWLVSFQARNIALTDGGDATARLLVACLVFLPIGAAWSLDAWRGRAEDPGRSSGAALWLFRAQVVLVLLVAGLHKTQGPMWIDGTAMSTIFLLDDFVGNLPVPEVLRESMAVSQAMTWGTLVFELVVPITIWFERTRRVSMAIAIAFHLFLLWSMNIFYFQLLMIVGWLSFLRPEVDGRMRWGVHADDTRLAGGP